MPRIANVLREGLKKEASSVLSTVTDSVDELHMIQRVYKEAGVTKENQAWVARLVKGALSDATSAKDNAMKVMATFVRYAQAKDLLTMKKQAQTTVKPMEGAYSLNPNLIPIPESAAALVKANMSPGAFDAKYVVVPDETLKHDSHNKNPAANFTGYADDGGTESSSSSSSDKNAVKTTDSSSSSGSSTDKNCADTTDAGTGTTKTLAPELKSLMPAGHPGAPEAPAVPDKPLFNLNDVSNVDADFDPATGKITMDIKNASRAQRDAIRAKYAQKGLQFSEMLQKSNPSGVMVPNLDTKPSGDLGRIENIKENHEKIMNNVVAPPKVREAAEKIQSFIAQGKIDPSSDFPGLIAEGLDPAAVSYWKQMWGEAKDKDASNFAADLVKQYSDKKKAAADEAQTVKVARAYETAYEMSRRGLIDNAPATLRKQAEAIMNYSDNEFEHFKGTVLRVPVAKQASFPQVGFTGLPELPAVQPASDLKSELDQAFATSTARRRF